VQSLPPLNESEIRDALQGPQSGGCAAASARERKNRHGAAHPWRSSAASITSRASRTRGASGAAEAAKAYTERAIAGRSSGLSIAQEEEEEEEEDGSAVAVGDLGGVRQGGSSACIGRLPSAVLQLVRLLTQSG
jgi:hypothetical protein